MLRSLDEGRHVLRAKVNSPEVLEEFFLTEPEDTIVGLGWLANILHLWVVGPSRSIVTPLTRSKLAFAPGVSYFDEIVLSSRDVVEAGDHCVSMSVDNAIGGVGVRFAPTTEFGETNHLISLHCAKKNMCISDRIWQCNANLCPKKKLAPLNTPGAVSIA